MAGRPKKIVSPLEENIIVKSDSEKLLEDKIKKLEELVSQLVSKSDIKNPYEDIFDEIKIPQDDYIKVVSLCLTRLNLSTLGMGKGKIFTFKEFGETKRILYSDLVEIIEHQDRFLKDGLFYIDDSRVIRRHGLDEVYEKILTKETIEKIMKNSQNAVSLFNSANDKQKETIARMFIDRLIKGEDVDLNLIDAITRLSNIKIVEIADEAKSYLELETEVK